MCRTAFGCFCDSVCEQYGDCCSNYLTTCDTPTFDRLSPAPLPTTSTPLTIVGTRFGADAGTVVVGTQSCPVISWASSQVVCTAPAGQGASTPLTLTSSRGTQGVTNLARRSPTVNGYSGAIPTSGGNVTLLGSDFGAPDASVSVSQGSVQGWTQSTVSWNAPAGVGSVSVAVTVSGQQSNAFAVPYQAPSIMTVSPASVPASGAIITISGANFGASASGLSATVGSLPCANPVMLVPHTSFRCTAPSGPAGTVPVRVSVTGGSSAPVPGAVTYPGPSIGSVSPPTVPTTGGVVTFTGTGLDTGVSVSVGGQACPATSPSATSWSCAVPAGVGRDLAVALNGIVQTPVVSYTAPSIMDVSPQSSSPSGGVLITITGSNFGAQASQNFVSIGASQCAVAPNPTPTAIRCTLPAGSGTQRLTLLVGGQEANTFVYVYAPPTLNSLTASSGSTLGGATLTLTGNNFGSTGASVRVGGLPCPIGSQQNTRVLCTLPPGAGGTVDVELSLASQVLTLPFTWDPPSITGISPAVSTRGAAMITLSGANFGSGAATSVSLGGSPCELSSRGHQQLICSAPPGQGTVTAIVDVANVTASSPYSYAAPSIDSVSPTRARTTGGTVLTISGDSFGTVQGSASLGGSTCTLRTQGHTVIRCDAPAGEGANLPLVVRVGTVQSAPFLYSYEAPVIDLLQPAVVQTRGGFVWILGRNFGQSPSVTVGGVPCPVLKSTDTELVCSVPSTASTAGVDVVVTASAQESNRVTLGREGSCGAELADGAACDDGVPCTGAGHCVGTTCVRGAANDEGVACDDGDPCTTGGTCRSGVCSATSSLDAGQRCVAASACTAVGACASGACGAVAAREGLACDDGDPATSGDVCTQARCVGDAGVIDAGIADAGAADAGELDAGEADAGEVDAGELDAGELDAGELDAGQADAGEPDAGRVDAGAVDSGVADAGAEMMPSDAGAGGENPPTGCGCSAVDPMLLFGEIALIGLRRRRSFS